MIANRRDAIRGTSSVNDEPTRQRSARPTDLAPHQHRRPTEARQIGVDDISAVLHDHHPTPLNRADLHGDAGDANPYQKEFYRGPRIAGSDVAASVSSMRLMKERD